MTTTQSGSQQLEALAALDEPFAEPRDAAVLHYEEGSLDTLRRFVTAHATRIGLGRLRTLDLVIAVHELASNSVTRGGGCGTLRLWHAQRKVVCEVRDLRDPLEDRRQGATGQALWLANRLCDLVQVRATSDEMIVRVHVSLA
jgi:anti-sigma regulatory factor (Ser/Thr protein kinase)